MNLDKYFSKFTTAVLCGIFLVGMIYAQAPTTQNPKNPDPELISQLSNELKVTPTQATGGAGAIFGLAKSRLSVGDFSKLAAAVPGMGGFLNAAPSTGGASAMGSLPGVPTSAGGLASLAGSFQSLGLSPSMIGKFAPIMQNYVGKKGGSGLASLFSGALK